MAPTKTRGTANTCPSASIRQCQRPRLITFHDPEHIMQPQSLSCVFGTLSARCSGAYIASCARVQVAVTADLRWPGAISLLFAPVRLIATAPGAPFFALAASIISETWLNMEKICFVAKFCVANYVLFLWLAPIGLWLFFCAQSTPNQWDKTSIVW